MNGKIIFYEEKNFQGRSYECNSDCSEISSHLSQCNSCRVENGIFMVYDQPNYMGQQFLLRRGEYPENQRMMGFTDCIRSCRMIPLHRGPFKVRVYERESFGGQMHELVDDCESFQDRYQMSDIQSCNVLDGHWLMFEQPNYQGRMLYLRPGEYRSLRDLCSADMRFSSIRRITECF